MTSSVVKKDGSGSRPDTTNNGYETQKTSKGPIPPDGGWGWVVVFGSFMIHLVTDGVVYSFGILFKELTESLKEGDGATSFILSLLAGITLCTGPISSILVNKYGCRIVTVAGSILAAICLALSAFANDVFTLYITIGIGTGLGFGLIYLPIIVSVTCYFENKRSLATGIAVCGSGLGTIIFSAILDKAVQVLTRQTTFLVLSLLVFSCLFFGLLFKPLKDPEEEEESDPETILQLKPFLVTLETEGADQKTLSIQNLSTKNNQSLAVVNGHGSNKRPHSVHGHDIILVAQQNGSLSNNPSNDKSNSQIDSNNLDDSKFTLSQPALWEKGALLGVSNNTINKANKNLSNSHGGSGLMHKKDILYFGSTRSIHNAHNRRIDVKTSQPTHASSLTLQSPVDNDQTDGKKDGEENTTCACLSPDTRQTLKEMLDFELLKDPIFILFTISNIFTSIGFGVPYAYIVKLADTHNIEDTNRLLQYVGGANLVSRVILGYMSDKAYINRLYLYNSCLSICGIATILSVFCYTHISMAIYASVFGAMIGAYVGLTSVVLVDLLGLDRLTNAFGLLLLFQGIASFVGPPVVGFIYDSSKSYNLGFYIAGGSIFVSGAMLFVIPYVQRYLLKKRQRQLAQS